VLGFQARYNDSEPEDEWFSKRVYLLPDANLPSSRDQALSVEDVYFENAMGYHVRDGGVGTKLSYRVWNDASIRKKIFNYCPELSMIMAMKLERERCPEGWRGYPTSWTGGGGGGGIASDRLEQFEEAANEKPKPLSPETPTETSELGAGGTAETDAYDENETFDGSLPDGTIDWR